MSLEYEKRIILGDDNNFLKVNHVILRGSNFEIGKKIGEIAKEDLRIVKVPWTDQEKVRLQAEFMKQNYPIHYERMRGVAASYGMDIEKNDNIDFSILLYHMGTPGCSAVFYPKDYTVMNQSILCRNFDFTTGTVMGMPPQNDEMAAISRPYIFEVYPEEGYTSMYLTSFDLLGGCIDGINSEGLTVTMLSDDESPIQHPEEPVLGSAVGIYELLIIRMILDTCKTVEEAKKLIFSIKQFYFFTSLHYLIADRFGNSFVFERSYTQNKEFVIHGNQKPQAVTNFLLHRYKNIEEIPDEDLSVDMYGRYKTIMNEINQKTDKFSIEDIKAINHKVYCTVGECSDTHSPPRTLWNSVYNLDERSLEISFYLRDEINSNSEKQIIHSDYFKFKLN